MGRRLGFEFVVSGFAGETGGAGLGGVVEGVLVEEA